MPSATTSEDSMSGSKRKAETGKEGHAKGSKKPKIDSSKAKSGTTKTQKPLPTKSTKKVQVAVPAQADSSDDDSDGLDSDGGVELENTEETDESSEQKQFEGVHPDRVKATSNGAGPNGTRPNV
jgi:hypothetical protein